MGRQIGTRVYAPLSLAYFAPQLPACFRPPAAARVALAAVLVAGVLLHAAVALSADGFLGIDAGAYLLSKEAVLGNDLGTDFTRPPLAPGLLLVPFTRLFGDVTGYAVFAVAAAVPLPLVTAVWVRSFAGAWPAALAAGLVAFDWLLMGMFASGALPLLGFATVVLAAYGLSSGRPRLAVLGIALTPWLNQTSAGLLFLLLPLWWLMLPDKPRNARAVLAGGLLALLALPWYMDAGPASAKLVYPGPIIGVHHPLEPQLWLGAIACYALWSMGRALSRRGTAPPAPVRLAMATAAALAVLQLFTSHNEAVLNLFYRSTYLAMPFFWLAMLYWWRSSTVRLAPRAWLAVLAAVALIAGQQGWQQARFSSTADTAALAVIDRIPEDAGTIGVNFYSLALYTSARTGKPAIWASMLEPPRAYADADQQVRGLLGWTESPPQAHQVTHLLVDERHPKKAFMGAPQAAYYDAPQQLWDQESLPHLALVAREGPVKLYAVQEVP